MLFKNDKAVSPVVATLVLVVVAIIGAAAVGALLGAFSSDVSDEASAGETSSASSSELLVAGSTTVQPVSELLAEAFMEDHKGVKVTVQGGGSGAGVSSAGMGIVDIGAASRAVKDTELDKYPDLQTHQIGGSAVVVIANTAAQVADEVSKAELEDLFINGTAGSTIGGNFSGNVTPYQRSEESGTEDTFKEWFSKTAEIDSGVEGVTGNSGVLSAVQDDSDGIGFVDFGYADGAVGIKTLGIYDAEIGSVMTPTSDNIKKELAATGTNVDTYYVHALTRPLNYITNGEPNTMQQAFITFAQSPGAAEYFEAVGYFPITAFA
ncbi:Phosphate ABC transporter, periplasmic phosphate-binding protein PstS [Methanosarcina siciliae C2J]|uniref:Phosphate ABC transporter, periplasmic phosphate-binding protein PstS n=1 Tax=Methanosarcina siciliae C2J TaxID=1434118 RepID=A0A0E3PP95_9EURY|nr:substrate-binding domain-containing protein [Methanosarcina siciliae]AKB37539.1 Phosphate ABC transporter, periplasmic phosphate-binding protein PstS [Methanosarcina siciliae C2J]